MNEPCMFFFGIFRRFCVTIFQKAKSLALRFFDVAACGMLECTLGDWIVLLSSSACVLRLEGEWETRKWLKQMTAKERGW